jgi:hypothetical protein
MPKDDHLIMQINLSEFFSQKLMTETEAIFFLTLLTLHPKNIFFSIFVARLLIYVLLGTRKTGQMCHSVVKISKPYLN